MFFPQLPIFGHAKAPAGRRFPGGQAALAQHEYPALQPGDGYIPRWFF